ncbi:MAG: aminotransferase class I/II-fold pyridoxal phosphate-dependent enzyme [Lachnospiraceae bacterium]|nr:aminotransferase class I/II-fold pyridoxal phosphate-dependent enzyme [Lachnospiraceae bacterium]
MKKNLTDGIKTYLEQDIYPMHMPGHKRNRSLMGYGLPGNAESYDLTEVYGTDDLHRSRGIIRGSMLRTAKLYGAGLTRYLVNGSTCGILAGIAALCGRRDVVIASRNCHISVAHAIEINDLKVKWMLPEYDEKLSIFKEIRPDTLKTAIEEVIAAGSFPSLVVITSPTYEGYLSDTESLSRICHDHGIPLLVDEAHGAHLRFTYDHRDALSQGADVVVQSPHKTLCSLTQSAWMHVSKEALIRCPGIEDRLEEKLSVYETSSPSYPLMLSLDKTSCIMESHAKELDARYIKLLSMLYGRLESLKCLKIPELSGVKALCENRLAGKGVSDMRHDPGKLLINTSASGINAGELAEILRKRYGYETEYAIGNNVLAMITMWDDAERLKGFAMALREIDEGLKEGIKEGYKNASGDVCGYLKELPCAVSDISDALTGERVFSVPYADGVAAEYIYCYPPGIPLMVPGEAVDENILSFMEEAKRSGCEILGSCSSFREEFCFQKKN